MDKLRDLTMRWKLLLSFGVLIAFLLLLTTVATLSLVSLRAAQDQLYQTHFADQRDLQSYLSNQNAIRANLLNMMLLTERPEQDRLFHAIQQKETDDTQALKRVLERNGDYPRISSPLQQLLGVLAAFRQTRDSQIMPLIYAGKIDQAQRLAVGLQAQRYQQLQALAQQALHETEQRAGTAVLASEVKARETVWMFALTGAVALAVAVWLARLLSQALAQPLAEISAVATRIAVGDLAFELADSGRYDEIGVLQQQFLRMAQSLQDKAGVAKQIAAGDLTVQVVPQSEQDVLGQAFALMVQSLSAKAEVAQRIAAGDLAVQVAPQSDKDVLGQAFAQMVQSLSVKVAMAKRIAQGDLTVQVTPQSEQDALGHAFVAMVDNLRQINSEVLEGVNVLAASASEIMAGTTQIASGAEQTAASITETTSTVEEVKQTAYVSSQKAKNVSAAAQTAAQVSQNGKKAVEEAVEGMQRIHEQMEQVAESIVRLSEQTQAIGEIITTVNDLAEQSNLLAVNASIEAAKAGEQGRGFAVVAQEVKSLAEQSKQATVQVRGILGEIQKATSGAVLATEQGSKAVEGGLKQSNVAGEAIRLLAESMVDSAQSASQIAVSAQQQLAGMDQLVLAMDNIRSAGSQNLASSKQAEVAAHNLHGLGQKLKDMLARYKL